MKLISLVILGLGLGLPAYASSNALGPYSQMLSTSKTLGEFIKKALAKNEYVRDEMLAYAKANDANRIPKSTYESGTLTLIEGDSKLALEIVNPKSGDFKVNGKPFKATPRDSVALLLRRLDEVINAKTSFFRDLFLPTANAIGPLGLGVVVVVVVAGVVIDYLRITCDEFPEHFADKTSDSYKDVVIRQIDACESNRTIVHLSDSGGDKKISYVRADLAQEGFIEEVTGSGKEAQTIKYIIAAKTRRNDPNSCVTVEINGVGYACPEDQGSFNKYLSISESMILGIGDHCQTCKDKKAGYEKMNKEFAKIADKKNKKRGQPSLTQ